MEERVYIIPAGPIVTRKKKGGSEKHHGKRAQRELQRIKGLFEARFTRDFPLSTVKCSIRGDGKRGGKFLRISIISPA